jgi:general secretion pathway protein F
MAVFAYRALNDQAAAVEGTIAADTARAARDALRLRGLIVESVTTTDAGKGNASIRLPLRGRQRYGAKRVAMVRELSTLLAAGIPLLESIDSLVLQQTGGFKQSMMILRDRIAAIVERLHGTQTACVLECVAFRNCVLSRVLLIKAAGSIPAASTF